MIRIALFAFVGASALLPQTTLACDGELLLSCPVGGGKRLEVCAMHDRFLYSFGPPAAPEIQLQALMADAPVTHWPGVGRMFWTSVTFRNRGYTYEVSVAADRNDHDRPFEAGVAVRQGDRLVTSLSCLPGTVNASPFVFSDAMGLRGW